MLPDQPFYFSVCELPLEAVASAHSPDSDSGIVKLSTTTVSRPRSRMVLVHFELMSDASALSGHTASLSVNGKAYHGLPFTMVNITALLSRKVKNELVIWGQPIPMHVTVHVDIVKKVTEEELLQTINDRAPYVHTHVDFGNLALSVAESRGYAELHVFKVSYLCPLTRSRMRVPGRGVRCRHLEGFDVFAYLGLNESSLEPSWCCPVCFEQVLVQDIRVDLALLEVVRSEQNRTVILGPYGVTHVSVDDDSANAEASS